MVVLEFSMRGRDGKVRACPILFSTAKEGRMKRKRKDGVNVKRNDGRGGWRWKAEVVGLTTKKKKKQGSHCGNRRKKRNREQNSKTAEDGEEKLREGTVKERGEERSG